MPPRTPHRTASILALIALLALAACSSAPSVSFVDRGASYTLREAEQRAKAVDAGAAGRVRVEDASAARQTALTGLRTQGALAGKAADLLTSAFPVGTRSVPVYAEAAKVDGRDAWIVVEAWGGRTGTLTLRRLWVFDRTTGAVASASTWR